MTTFIWSIYSIKAGGHSSITLTASLLETVSWACQLRYRDSLEVREAGYKVGRFVSKLRPILTACIEAEEVWIHCGKKLLTTLSLAS